MKTTPTTGGEAPGAAAELPVVAWRPAVKCTPEMGFNAGAPRKTDIDYWQSINCGIQYACDLAPAQSHLDALREEVARLTKERDEARAELASLKAQPTDVDALMALAQDFANAHAMAFYADPELEPDSDEIAGRMKFADTAREALRAKLAARKEEL